MNDTYSSRPPFDWSLLPAFLAALEHGSLMGAARATGVSQPTLGRHIAELEAQWGVLLFERTGRGLLPTREALRLAEWARQMEGAAQGLERQLAGAATSLSGSVRLSASQPVACYLLPPVLARLRNQLPDVQVELVVSNAVSNLLRREADIALRMVRPDQSTLVARRIGEVQVVACAHRDYLRRRGTPRQPADLAQHDFVGGDRVQEVQDGLRSAGLVLPDAQFPLRTDDLVAAWQGVRAGLGIGFVGRYLLRTDPDVQLLPLPVKLPRLPIWLTVHREIRTSQRIRAVMDVLAAELPGEF